MDKSVLRKKVETGEPLTESEKEFIRAELEKVNREDWEVEDEAENEESETVESEFKVSEQTAEWLRLLRRFQSLWDDALILDMDGNYFKNIEVEKASKIMEQAIFRGVNNSISDIYGMGVYPDNVI